MGFMKFSTYNDRLINEWLTVNVLSKLSYISLNYSNNRSNIDFNRYIIY